MVAYNNFVLLKPLFADNNATQDFIKSEDFKNKSVQICSYLREENLHSSYYSRLYSKQMLLIIFIFKFFVHLEIQIGNCDRI